MYTLKMVNQLLESYFFVFSLNQNQFFPYDHAPYALNISVRGRGSKSKACCLIISLVKMVALRWTTCSNELLEVHFKFCFILVGKLTMPF